MGREGKFFFLADWGFAWQSGVFPGDFCFLPIVKFNVVQQTRVFPGDVCLLLMPNRKWVLQTGAFPGKRGFFLVTFVSDLWNSHRWVRQTGVLTGGVSAPRT